MEFKNHVLRNEGRIGMIIDHEEVWLVEVKYVVYNQIIPTPNEPNVRTLVKVDEVEVQKVQKANMGAH